MYRILMTIVLAFTLQAAYPQSMWKRVKEKANKAWNSDMRKNVWEKTKEKASAVMESDALEAIKYSVPLTNREFYNVVPDNYLLSLSTEQYNRYLSGSKRSTNSTQRAQVERVSRRLIEATKRLMRNNGRSSELAGYSWQITLVKNSEANAFCMPGGKIAVYDGILPITKDDASLACVIGHEIAHAIAKHSAEQLTKSMISTVGLYSVLAIISNSDMSSRKKQMAAILASSGATLATLKFSRLNETEADRLGLILTSMAGYDPSAAVRFWQRMGEQSKLKTSRDWFSTHPSNTNRIQNIKSFLPEAKSYYGK